MGHYYSEMVSDEEQERQAQRDKDREDYKVLQFEALVEQYGLARAIVMVLEDRTRLY